MRIELAGIIIITFSIISCQNSQVRLNDVNKPGKMEMTDLNRYLVQKDREIIQNYIERKNLKMTESPTGLWYYVKNEGSGEFLKDNDRIVMDYECSLLDGTECYSSASLGPKEIILGRTAIEPGMNEGFRLLRPGAEAIFILPPFLAYGIVGDGKKIPPRSIIVYSVRLIKDKNLE
jgi:FKBP-type peptidyl-prolyl cis-trans isomerase FkpA